MVILVCITLHGLTIGCFLTQISRKVTGEASVYPDKPHNLVTIPHHRCILTHFKTDHSALNREVVPQLLVCMKFRKGLFYEPSCACAASAVNN